jgi:hypothetical protein
MACLMTSAIPNCALTLLWRVLWGQQAHGHVCHGCTFAPVTHSHEMLLLKQLLQWHLQLDCRLASTIGAQPMHSCCRLVVCLHRGSQQSQLVHDWVAAILPRKHALKGSVDVKVCERRCLSSPSGHVGCSDQVPECLMRQRLMERSIAVCFICPCMSRYRVCIHAQPCLSSEQLVLETAIPAVCGCFHHVPGTIP